MKKLKITKLIASTLIVVSVLALNPTIAHAEWKSDSNGWWYTEGNSYYTGWQIIDGNWYYFYQSGYMAHNVKIGSYYIDDNGKSTIIENSKTQDYEQRINIILAKIIKDEMTEKQKVKAIHDWIIDNTKYDETYTIYDGYETLVNGTGVCQGYAELAQQMFKQVGIENMMITGSANNGSHAWNLVNINGKWRHVDVTWDDATLGGFDDTILNSSTESKLRDKLLSLMDKLRNDYFCLTDDEISHDHTWNTSEYPAAN